MLHRGHQDVHPSREIARLLRRTAVPSTVPVRDTPGVLAPPPLIYIGGLAVGFGLDALLPSERVADWLAWSLGGVLIIAGSALAWSFLAALRHAQTPVDPYKATARIVTTGPYRLSRNPGYVGMALTVAGICVLAGAPWALLTLIPTMILIDRGVIKREERYLEAKFGEEYVRYKARTRRWL